jgi:sugar-specific transcriptional regulator TrmB
MVRKDDIKTMVTAIVAEMKAEIKKEIIAEVKETLTKEITDSVKSQVRDDFENKIDQKAKTFMSETKEIADGVNMDITNIWEKFQGLRSMQSQMKQYKSLTESALTLANQNQQYSQKNNIKFLGWKEKPHENLREELCAIMRETVNVTIEPMDILAIHRIPGAQGKYTWNIIIRH